jgi:hypothetical protein
VTVGEWLSTRQPQPPAALLRRLEAVLGAELARPAAETPEVCLRAGERLAAELLVSNSTSRDSALDLLTADALVTYAFEAASNAPADIDAHAAGAMMRIAAIAVAASPLGSPA